MMKTYEVLFELEIDEPRGRAVPAAGVAPGDSQLHAAMSLLLLGRATRVVVRPTYARHALLGAPSGVTLPVLNPPVSSPARDARPTL